MKNSKESGKQISEQKGTKHGEAEEKGEQPNEQIQMEIDPQKRQRRGRGMHNEEAAAGMEVVR